VANAAAVVGKSLGDYLRAWCAFFSISIIILCQRQVVIVNCSRKLALAVEACRSRICSINMVWVNAKDTSEVFNRAIDLPQLRECHPPVVKASHIVWLLLNNSRKIFDGRFPFLTL
jgi:hypothetical protein